MTDSPLPVEVAVSWSSLVWLNGATKYEPNALNSNVGLSLLEGRCNHR